MQAPLPPHCRFLIKVTLFYRYSPPAPKFFIKPQAPKDEGAWPEGLASAESSCRGGGVEEPAEALGAAGDPAQVPADAGASLEAKVGFPVALWLCVASKLPPRSRARASLPRAARLVSALRAGWAAGPAAGRSPLEGRTRTVLLGGAHSDPTDLC